MQINMTMQASKDTFVVERWWATSPEFAVASLKAQLAAATAIWPDLKEYGLGKRRPKNPESKS